MTNQNALEVHDLTVTYDSKPVLWDIDLQIPAGKLVAVVGPNGAGKSTLIKSILNLVKPLSGSVQFPQLDLKPNRKGSCSSSKIAYVPQSGSVDWDFPATVLDVVIMGVYGRLGWFKRPTKNDFELARHTLKTVGMEAFADRQISQLSGGQQQRVFLARALIQQAEIYFMDEPFKGVDIQTEKAIVNLLKDLQKQNKTVIVVHHDLNTVAEYFDWVALINLEIIASGAVEDIFNEENLKLTYGSSNLLKRGI